MVKIRYLMPCREGVYFAGVLAFILTGAMLREINLLMVMAGMMFGPFVGSIFMSLANIRRLSIARVLPNHSTAGEAIAVELVARSARRSSSWSIIAYDRIEHLKTTEASSPVQAEVCFSHIPAKSETACVYRIRPNRRGRYRFGPMKVATRFPMSLMWAIGQTHETNEMVVFPRRYELSRRWRELFAAAPQGSQSDQNRRGHSEGDFRGIRDWRSGDSQRWVHWRASARLGRLAVREFGQSQHRDLVVLLDLWRPATLDDAASENIETAISFASSIVFDACRRGASQMVLAVAGAKLESRSGPASQNLELQWFEWLAQVEAGDRYTPAQLKEAAAGHRLQGAQTILISTRPSVALADSASESSQGREGETATSSGASQFGGVSLAPWIAVHVGENSFGDLFQGEELQ